MTLNRQGAAAAALAAVLAWSAAAGAQGFSDYVKTPEHRAVREAVALRQLRTICPASPALADVESRVRIVRPVAMLRGARYPEAGVWEERLIGAGCADGRQLNLIFNARAGGKPPTGTAMFPGTTHANWFLQQQAMRPAAVAAAKKAPEPGCRRYAVADTAGAAAPPEDPAPGDRWSEQWRLRACDDFVEITITFSVPETGGIAIEAE